MHQSIPAVPRSPLLLRGICLPCQSLGWGLCKFCSAQGLGICQPRGYSQTFDTHIVSYWNITTQRGFYKKNKHIGLFLKDRKQLKRIVKAWLSLILCMHFFIAYQARFTQWNQQLWTWINVFQLRLNWIKFLLILFEEHPFKYIKLFDITYNFLPLY